MYDKYCECEMKCFDEEDVLLFRKVISQIFYTDMIEKTHNTLSSAT